MQLSVHDPKGRRRVADSHVLSRSKRNVQRVEKALLFRSHRNRTGFATALPQHSGQMLCKRTVVPKIITLNDKDRASRKLPLKRCQLAKATSVPKEWCPTLWALPQLGRTYFEPRPQPKKPVFVSCNSADTLRRHQEGFEAFRWNRSGYQARQV